MNFKRLNAACFLLTMTLLIGSRCYAIEGPEFDLQYLKGIDSVLVIDETESSGRHKSEPNFLLSEVMIKALRANFESEKWISIKPLNNLSYEEKGKGNHLFVHFRVSDRKEIFDGTRRASSLSMQLRLSQYTNGMRVIPTFNVTYPFFSRDHEQYVDEIGKGVKILTAHLPMYFSCANRKPSCEGNHLKKPYKDIVGQEIPDKEADPEFLKLLK